MYPRLLQLFLNNQIENLTAVFNDEYDTPSHTKKVFANIRRQGKDFSGTVTPLFATMLIQSQAVEGEDETVHEERGDSVERAATTATSLDAEHGSVNTLGSEEDSMKLQELMDLCTKLFDKVLNLENVKDAQALEIKKLKKRVKKLESKKLRTPQLKRRLFKVRIESFVEKSLGDPKDTSKQGRNKIDQDKGISWFQEDAETQGWYGHDTEINTTSTSITTASINITTVEPVTTASAPVTIAGVSVSTAEPSTPPTTTTTTSIEDEDLTITQTLIKMKTQRLQAELDKEARLEREREEEASKVVNIAEWDDVQAMMDADYELAVKLQAEEQGGYLLKKVTVASYEDYYCWFKLLLLVMKITTAGYSFYYWVLVTKPHNKTPYEPFLGRKPALGFMRSFGCPATILNTIDHLGKFDGKDDEGFFVGYSINNKAFRVKREWKTVTGKDYIANHRGLLDPPFLSISKSSADADPTSSDDEKKVNEDLRKNRESIDQEK
ncbi:hypothetical protein Tco_1038970 [Tanacetum coccineum]